VAVAHLGILVAVQECVSFRAMSRSPNAPAELPVTSSLEQGNSVPVCMLRKALGGGGVRRSLLLRGYGQADNTGTGNATPLSIMNW